MVSTRTANRQRDRVNMAEFKELSRQVKKMLDMAKPRI
jgi:hypothetical protein